MSCNEKIDYFAYIEGLLPEWEKNNIDNHIKNCASCVELVRITEKANCFFEYKKSQAANPFLYTKIMQRLQQKEAIWDYRKRFIFQPAIVFVIVMAALATGFYLGNMYSGVQQSTSEQTLSNAFIVKEPLEMALLNE